MAETSGFFQAQINEQTGDYDRKYLAREFANYFALFIKNGVFGSPTNQLLVTPEDGLSISVSSGNAFIKGMWYNNSSKKKIVLVPNYTSSNRIDTIRVRMDDISRIITADVYTGDEELVRNEDVFDLQLAVVVVKPGATTITAADIQDTRPNESVCGFVTQLLRAETTADLFAQYQSMFSQWFEGVKDTLSGDVAGNLYVKIENVETRVTDLEDNQYSLPIATDTRLGGIKTGGGNYEAGIFPVDVTPTGIATVQVRAFKGATTTSNGNPGGVPAPSMGSNVQVLLSNGTWGEVTSSLKDFEGCTSTMYGKRGAVPAPNRGDQGKFLSAEGSFKSIPIFQPNTSTNYGASGLVPGPRSGLDTKSLLSIGGWIENNYDNPLSFLKSKNNHSIWVLNNAKDNITFDGIGQITFSFTVPKDRIFTSMWITYDSTFIGDYEDYITFGPPPSGNYFSSEERGSSSFNLNAMVISDGELYIAQRFGHCDIESSSAGSNPSTVKFTLSSAKIYTTRSNFNIPSTWEQKACIPVRVGGTYLDLV